MIGITGVATTTVTFYSTAKAVGSGSLEVFSTPMMIALMEKAACNCLSKELEPGQTSVGTHICIDHMAASACNANVSADAVIDSVEGRKIIFKVSAWEGDKQIGYGTHVRVIVDARKFMGKLGGVTA